MIVGQQKPFEEIWEMVKDYKKIVVTGCNTCVAISHAGGEKEAEILASMLRMKAKQEDADMEISHNAIERHCEPEFFEPVMEAYQAADLVLSLACGVGVNFLSDRIGETPVFPGVNTLFFGAVPEAGIFEELCAGCGDCILHTTGGICPVARCSKSLMNGPCGGTNDGKCEVSSDTDCAWYLIVKRMEKLGMLDKLDQVRPPRDWSPGTHGGPRRVSMDHIKAAEEAEENKEA